ncbi:MAG: hypothetical protein WAL11_17235, partial [Pseudolabrys sp.]
GLTSRSRKIVLPWRKRENPEYLFYFSAQSGKLTKGVRQQSQKALPIMAAFANLRKNRLLWSQL